MGVRPGDAIVPYSPFAQLGNPKMYVSKALDNRLGCATALGVLKELQRAGDPNVCVRGRDGAGGVVSPGRAHPRDLVDPDIAISIDVGVAGDTPGIDSGERQHLGDAGKGPLLMIYDHSMIPNNRFRDFVLDIAASEKIPVQLAA